MSQMPVSLTRRDAGATSVAPRAAPLPALLPALLAALLVTLAVTLFAPPPADADAPRIWVKGYDFSDKYETWSRIARGPSGTVYVAGTRNGTEGGGSATVAKYTRAGRRLWVRTYAGLTTGSARIMGLAVDARGNAIVAGDEIWPSAGGWHIFVAKFAARSGKRLWLKRYNGPATLGNDNAYDVALGARGAVYVAGNRTATGGGFDALLLKYVDKGARATRAWVRTYSNPTAPPLLDADVAKCVEVDSKGRIFFGGESDDGTGVSNDFVRRVTRAGATVWTTRMNSPAGSHGEHMSDMATGGGYVATIGWSSDGGSGGNGRLVYLSAVSGWYATRWHADSRWFAVAMNGSGMIAAAGVERHPVTQIESATFRRWEAGPHEAGSAVFPSDVAGKHSAFFDVALGPTGAIYCAGTSWQTAADGEDFSVVKYAPNTLPLWYDIYDAGDSDDLERCHRILYVGGSKGGLYAAGSVGGLVDGRAMLIRYSR